MAGGGGALDRRRGAARAARAAAHVRGRRDARCEGGHAGGGGNGSVGSSEAREASISENSGIAKVQRSALRLRFTLFGSDGGETVVQ